MAGNSRDQIGYPPYPPVLLRKVRINETRFVHNNIRLEDDDAACSQIKKKNDSAKNENEGDRPALGHVCRPQ